MTHLIRLGGAVASRLEIHDFGDTGSRENAMASADSTFGESQAAQNVDEIVKSNALLGCRIQ